MIDYDVYICGGIIVDGTRVSCYWGDVWISGGCIVQIGGCPWGIVEWVIDVMDCIVAFGFVDFYMHYDAQICWDLWCIILGWYGVMLVVLGNCGFGFALVWFDFRERFMFMMTRIEVIFYVSMEVGMVWDWEIILEYFDSLERVVKGVNCIQYMLIASLMIYVMGFEVAKQWLVIE